MNEQSIANDTQLGDRPSADSYMAEKNNLSFGGDSVTSDSVAEEEYWVDIKKQGNTNL